MFFKNDATGVIDLDTLGAIKNELGLETGSGLGSGDGSDVAKQGPKQQSAISAGRQSDVG
jgi:hypothetical protein